MRVHQILKSKADDAVVTVTPSTLIADAAQVLAERKIGTVVVSNDGMHPMGILSERDIVRQLARKGASILHDPVSAHMTSRLVTCGRDDSAELVMQKMTDGRFRHMPVLEGDVLVGIVTLGDVVKARLTEISMEKDALEGMIMGH